MERSADYTLDAVIRQYNKSLELREETDRLLAEHEARWGAIAPEILSDGDVASGASFAALNARDAASRARFDSAFNRISSQLDFILDWMDKQPRRQ